MRKLDRYISKTVLQAMLLVLFGLASLDLIFTVFAEVGETNDRYEILDALNYVLLTFPRHLYELLPMTALMGALLGLGVLASNNELVILRAAGVRVSRIVWSVLQPSLLVMLLGLVLGEFVAPTLELRAEVNKSVANGEEILLSRYGTWQRDGDQFMHFNAIDPEGVLHGVSIYEFDDQRQLVNNSFAETAAYQQQEDNSYWILQQGRQTDFSYSDDGEIFSSSSEFESRDWQVDLTPDLLQILIIDTDKMAISDLYRFSARFIQQGQDAGPYLLSFWRKVLQPLTTASLVLVAVSFIFGPLREATMGSRVFTAICFGLLFIIVQRLFNTVSLVYQIMPFLAVLLPVLLIALLGLYLLKRSV